MRSSSKINLMGEYIVDKTRSLGKGATGEVFMGTLLAM